MVIGFGFQLLVQLALSSLPPSIDQMAKYTEVTLQHLLQDFCSIYNHFVDTRCHKVREDGEGFSLEKMDCAINWSGSSCHHMNEAYIL